MIPYYQKSLNYYPQMKICFILKFLWNASFIKMILKTNQIVGVLFQQKSLFLFLNLSSWLGWRFSHLTWTSKNPYFYYEASTKSALRFIHLIPIIILRKIFDSTSYSIGFLLVLSDFKRYLLRLGYWKQGQSFLGVIWPFLIHHLTQMNSALIKHQKFSSNLTIRFPGKLQHFDGDCFFFFSVLYLHILNPPLLWWVIWGNAIYLCKLGYDQARYN